MKKIKKVIFMIVIAFLAICQMNLKTYSYSLEEVKYLTNFKIVQEDGAPSRYDILMDASDMIKNQRIPCIRKSIDSILYHDEALLNINFLTGQAASSDDNVETVFEQTGDKISQTIRSIVQASFKILRYITFAATLTLLIYIAVMLVYSGISKKESFLPFGSFFKGGKGKNPEQHSKEKRFVEQWIISILILTILPYAINLIVSFSSFITDLTDQYRTGEDSIIVYVQNSQIDGENVDYYFETNIEGLLMFQSQYDWERFAIKNIVNLISGIILTIFKIFLYVLFILRMVIVAILTAISPILLLIHAFMKINGNKGILKNWFMLYFLCVLSKPVLALTYYILAKTNVYLVSENPLYILIIVAFMVGMIVLSIGAIRKSFKNTAKKNIVNKNT